jgi:hypothetical protein
MNSGGLISAYGLAMGARPTGPMARCIPGACAGGDRAPRAGNGAAGVGLPAVPGR